MSSDREKKEAAWMAAYVAVHEYFGDRLGKIEKTVVGQAVADAVLVSQAGFAPTSRDATGLLAALEAFPIRQSETDADYLALCFDWWTRTAHKAIAKATGGRMDE